MPFGTFRQSLYLANIVLAPAEPGWDIANATWNTNSSGSVATSFETLPTDLTFSVDGTLMYVIGSGGDVVRQYGLSTAWDVNTATYQVGFSVGSQETLPQAIFFKSDGTKMYAIGTNTDRVYQYSLSTPWQVDTASYDSISYLASGEETTPTGLHFKPDGTKMYIVGTTGDRVREYNLSTAWDVSTVSYVTATPIFTA